MHFPHKHLAQDCQKQKVPDNLSLEIWLTKNNFCLQLGEYVQVHQEDEPRNTISINRTVGAIDLGPQYNLWGGYFLRAY